MNLRGQQGYAMVTLLVGMAIMAILMTAAMPAWNQIARREKEAELVFRGQQYARAIGMFQRKAGPGVLPPGLDVLIDQKFLRKKYKDPITGQDFDLLTQTQQAPGSSTPGGPQGPGSRGSGASGGSGAGQGALVSATPQQGRGGAVAGGVMGVASKSKAESLRVYNGRTHYNEWQFVYIAQTNAPGAGGNQTNQPPGARGGNPPAPGAPPFGGRGLGGRGSGGRGSEPGQRPSPRGGGPGTNLPGGRPPL